MAKVTRQGANQADVVKILKALRSRVSGVSGLAVGTTTSRIKTVNAVSYCINGVNYSKAATDNIDITTAAGLVNTAPNQFCKLRVEINSGGTVSAVQGGIAASQAAAPFPTRSSGKATLGYIEIPASFTFGTTAFNVAGVAMVEGDPDLAATELEA